MKFILILIVAASIILGGWYFYNNRTVPTLDIDTTTEAHEDVDEEESDTEETTENTGSDAGMEFPTIDGNVDLSIDPNAKVFNVSGSNHTFNVNEIRVKEGNTVVINFESASGFHDWVLDEFDARTERVRDGDTSSVTFVADKKGTFEYYCSVGDHRAQGMVGALIVE